MDPEHGDKPSVSGASAADRVEGPSGSRAVKGKRRRRRATAKAHPHASQVPDGGLVRRPQNEGPAEAPVRKRKRRRRGKGAGAPGQIVHSHGVPGKGVAGKGVADQGLVVEGIPNGGLPAPGLAAHGRAFQAAPSQSGAFQGASSSKGGPAAAAGQRGADGRASGGSVGGASGAGSSAGHSASALAGRAKGGGDRGREANDGARTDGTPAGAEMRRAGDRGAALSGGDRAGAERQAAPSGHKQSKANRGERQGNRHGGKSGRGQRALQGRPLTPERAQERAPLRDGVQAARAAERPQDGQAVRAGERMADRPTPPTGPDRTGHHRPPRDPNGARGREDAEAAARTAHGGRGQGPARRDGQEQRHSGTSGPRMEQGRGPGDAGLVEGVDGGWRPLLRSDAGRRFPPGQGRHGGQDGGRGSDSRDASGSHRQRGGEAALQEAPLYAALDLGTNNCRLLIAQPTRPGQFRVVDAFSRIVRLGEGLAATGRLSDEAMERSVEALRICAAKLRNRQIRMSRLIATEAARAAENGEAFLERVANETGLTLEIINRETEARLAVSGCSSLVGRETKSVVLFDIGGGSSEIAVIRIGENRSSRLANHITHWTSLPVGVVTLSERHGGRDVTPERFEAMVVEVAGMLSHFESPPVEALTGDDPQSGFHLIGTSGTVTTLAGVHLDLPRYDRRRVDGVWLTDDEVSAMQARLLSWDFAARAANPCIGPDRADLVLAGCAILEAIRRRWPSTRMRVADRGLREGLLTDMMADDGAWRRGRRQGRNGRDDSATTGGAKP